jgi:IS5 family transposase
MFKVLQTLYTLVDDQTEYQLKDRLSFMRFVGLALHDPVPDAIEAHRPRLTQAENNTIKGGGVPAEWKPTRRAQIDRDGRWTIKRGRRREAAPPSSDFHPNRMNY